MTRAGEPPTEHRFWYSPLVITIITILFAWLYCTVYSKKSTIYDMLVQWMLSLLCRYFLFTSILLLRRPSQWCGVSIVLWSTRADWLMVNIHRFLVTRVFLLLCAVYILSKVVVVVFQSLQCIQHHCVLTQVFVISHLIVGILILLLTLVLKKRNIGQRTMDFFWYVVLIYATISQFVS